MKSSVPELAAVAAAEAAAKEQASAETGDAMTVTFINNLKGVPVADFHMGKRRLLATTHPATIVAAMFAMERTRLTVTTTKGSYTGSLQFLEPDEAPEPLGLVKMVLTINPQRCQFLHLAPDDNYELLLQGFDLFAREDWRDPPEEADEHLRAAHHHLPKDVIRRPLLTPDPKGWKKTLKRRNGWIYYPFC